MLYLIACDFAGADSEAARAVDDAMAYLGGQRMTPTQWVVESEFNAEDLWIMLVDLTRAHDAILVAELTQNAQWTATCTRGPADLPPANSALRVEDLRSGTPLRETEHAR